MALTCVDNGSYDLDRMSETDSVNPNLVRWHSRNLQVLQTLPDKEYKLRITAIDVVRRSNRNVLEFDVGVRTPINPVPTIPQVFTGTVNTIPAKTQSVTRSYEYITLKIISAVMYPEDPVAGDKLIWIIKSMGGVDRYELIFEDDVINNDERKDMGYNKVDYPYYIEVDVRQLLKVGQ